jgi:hypothetical protein
VYKLPKTDQSADFADATILAQKRVSRRRKQGLNKDISEIVID